MDLSARFRLNGSRIIQETFDDEVVIVNLDSGRYYCLQRVGAEIWALIVSGHRLAEVVGRLAAHYEASQTDLAAAVDRLCRELQEQSLVVEAEPEFPGAPAAITRAASADLKKFEPPQLQIFSDMQDLLLLDPIHEVDLEGWPAVKSRNDTPAS